MTHDNITPVHDNYSLSEQAAYEQGRTDQKVECLLHTSAPEQTSKKNLQVVNNLTPEPLENEIQQDFEVSVRNDIGCFQRDEVSAAALTHAINSRHQAALTARDAEWVAAVYEMRSQVEYNKHDMGEMGLFIRTEYVTNGIDALLAKFKGGKQ